MWQLTCAANYRFVVSEKQQTRFPWVFSFFYFLSAARKVGGPSGWHCCRSTAGMPVRPNYFFSRTLRPWEEHRCPPLDTRRPIYRGHFQIMLWWGLERFGRRRWSSDIGLDSSDGPTEPLLGFLWCCCPRRIRCSRLTWRSGCAVLPHWFSRAPSLKCHCISTFPQQPRLRFGHFCFISSYLDPFEEHSCTYPSANTSICVTLRLCNSVCRLVEKTVLALDAFTNLSLEIWRSCTSSSYLFIYLFISLKICSRPSEAACVAGRMPA